MNLETIAVVVGLVCSVGVNVGALFYWAGKIREKVNVVEQGIGKVSKNLKELDVTNKESHFQISVNLERTGKDVVKIEEHMRSLNGSVAKNCDSIEKCEEAIDKNTERIFTHTHGKE